MATTNLTVAQALQRVLSSPAETARLLDELDRQRKSRPGRGGVSARYRGLLDDRDEALRRLRNHPRFRKLDLTEAATQIEVAARRYEAHRWPHEQLWAGPPQSEPAKTFWEILVAGAPLIGKKRLKEILKVEIQS